MNGKPFTPDEIEYISLCYPNMRTSIIASHLGRSISSIYHQAYKLNIKKSAEFLRSPEAGILIKGNQIGKRYRFPKGHVPANKGKKQTEYMDAAAIEKTKATRFKKGDTPANHRPVGSERITVDGYTEIKVSEPNKWRPKHRVLYEKHYGVKIPKGHKCIFIDGNKQNFDISNLIVEAPAIAIRRNTIYRYPKDLRLAIRSHKRLLRTIKNKTNE